MARINSRSKGKAGELELSHFLTDKGFPARRSQQYKGTGTSGDITCDRLSAFYIECKRVQSLNVSKVYFKAMSEAAEEELDPLLMHRKNGEKWLVTLDLSHFLSILEDGASFE